jgi:hypothetical protein
VTRARVLVTGHAGEDTNLSFLWRVTEILEKAEFEV